MKPSLVRGIKYYHAKKYKQALKEFKSLEDQSNVNIELMYYIGLCLTQLGDYDEALLYLEQVVQSEFSFLHTFQSRMVLGFIYSVTGRYKLAEYEFKTLIESGFESSQIYAALGFVHYSQGDVDKSIESLEKSLAMEPENANAMNSLGFILAEEEIDLKRAIRLCKAAVRKKPGNASYQDSLGWAYFKNGMLTEARKHLRKALDLAPGTKDIVIHMKKILESDKKGKIS